MGGGVLGTPHIQTSRKYFHTRRHPSFTFRSANGTLKAVTQLDVLGWPPVEAAGGRGWGGGGFASGS